MTSAPRAPPALKRAPLAAAPAFAASALLTPRFAPQSRSLQAHYGAGDVVWPAAVALARLLAHCPSFAAQKRVLEIGAGLGLPGASAAQAGAASLLLADRDGAALALAARSAALNAPALAQAGRVATLVADWGGDLGAWPPAGAVDLVLASDVLYDAAAPPALAALLARLLSPAAAAPEAPPRALFADPPQRLHRDAFVAACAAQGLTAQVGPLPGPEGMLLIAVVRASA